MQKKFLKCICVVLVANTIQVSKINAGSGKNIWKIYNKRVVEEPKENKKEIYSEKIVFSTNKSLSEFGPDSPAKLTIICNRFNFVAIKIEFPGYPMSRETGELILDLEIAGYVKEKINAESTRELFEVKIVKEKNQGIWRQIGKKMGKIKIEAEDNDGVKLEAKFVNQEISCR